MNPLVRQQVAAALVGKPVLGVARPPREKNGSQQPDTDNPPTSPTKTGFQSDWAERESEFRAETLPDAKMNPEPTMDSQEISAAEATRSNINKIFTATDMSQEKFDKAIKLGFVFRRLFIAGILIAVILIVGVKLFHRARPYSKPQVAASVSAPQSQNNAAPTPSVTPVLNQVQPAASAGSSVETANLAAAPSQVQDNPKSDQTMETIRSIVVAENQKISEFRTNCDEIISAHSKNIQNTSISVRQALMDQLLRVQHRAGMVLTNQISFMDYQQQLLQNITQHHLPIEQDALDKLNAAAPKMENERRNVFVLLNKINDEIVSARQ